MQYSCHTIARGINGMQMRWATALPNVSSVNSLNYWVTFNQCCIKFHELLGKSLPNVCLSFAHRWVKLTKQFRLLIFEPTLGKC